MREILFRGAQRVDGAKSLIWYEGSLIIETDSYTGEKEYYIQNENGPFLVIPETVGQYAESNDRDCNKIFEGDIVEFYIDDLRIAGKVFYSKDATAFKVWYELPEQRLFILSKTLCDCEYIKVIGNIHDNPELLKEADNDKL